MKKVSKEKQIIANYKIVCKEKNVKFKKEAAELRFIGVFDGDYEFCDKKTELDCGLRIEDLPVAVDMKETFKMMIYDANIISKNGYYYDFEANVD